jgi:hypothetical protein
MCLFIRAVALTTVEVLRYLATLIAYLRRYNKPLPVLQLQGKLNLLMQVA